MDAHDAIDPSSLGRVIEADGAELLRFERLLAASPEALWDALTAPDHTAAWAFRGNFEPRPGGTVEFDVGAPEPVRGTVLAWDPPRVLEYAWDGPGGRWHVCCMVDEAREGGVLLTFDHLTPDPHDPDMAAGWHWHLDRLGQLLAGERPAPVFSDPHFDELQRLYARAEG